MAKQKYDINNWDHRVLCDNSNCTGVVGPKGRCNICGLAYRGELPFQEEKEEIASRILDSITCGYCNKSIPADVYFCPNCGNKLKITSELNNTSAIIKVDSKKRLTANVQALLFIFFLCIIAYFYLNSGQGNQGKQENIKESNDIPMSVIDNLKQRDDLNVINILGKPDSVQEGDNSKQWYYNNLSIVSTTPGIKYKHIQIAFDRGVYQDGKPVWVVRTINYSGWK